jgi:iron complex transport system substrate-binding protein
MLAAGMLSAAAVTAHAAAAITVSDARGNELTLERPAARIVSLAPHVTELLYAAGAGDRLIAAVEFSDYPPAARELPRVGNSSRLDVERLLALAPDLIIAWKTGNDRADIARLERLGLPVYVTEIAAISEIPGQILMLGRLAGSEEVAAPTAAQLRARLDALADEYGDREPVTVFYQIWERPLMTVNGRSFISDSIRLCGGRNVFDILEPIAPTVSVEAVIAADPQVIVNSASDENNEAQLAAWRRWTTISAVRHGNLFGIPSDLIARPTSRIVEGVERLCRLLDTARERL